MFSKLDPKNKGFNLVHIEWKVTDAVQDGKSGVQVEIKDSAIKSSPKDFIHMLTSLASDQKWVGRAIIKAGIEIMAKERKAREDSFDKMMGNPVEKLSELSKMLDDLLATSKSK